MKEVLTGNFGPDKFKEGLSANGAIKISLVGGPPVENRQRLFRFQVFRSVIDKVINSLPLDKQPNIEQISDKITIWGNLEKEEGSAPLVREIINSDENKWAEEPAKYIALASLLNSSSSRGITLKTFE